MILTYEYDTEYHGPAVPVVQIGVSNVTDSEMLVEITGIVDSGADATMIPNRDLRRIGARKVDRRTVRGIAGFGYSVDIYEVALKIGPFKVSKLHVVADKQNGMPVIGRDVLNQFVVTLNGLAHIVEISQ